ncbi:hypothetical protein QK292_17820 [Arthrobacter sp. AL08]|uniref:hypothetical protein n=1 Tax=unclassified Arthrobacter TaxID=235627 RepID=UPI001CFF9D90|nr:MULTISPECIES: hypothetical protein [unclassified Arthrobacter]MDI3243402.1 hypothetical protein [Arthrobacter sp. AL05]MDI3279411.1 hypothetical protein [Arthrobacter sp. AL08]WGZ80740.1 hypothetical protein QI450_06000 [Arthrobacter sp. EM1]
MSTQESVVPGADDIARIRTIFARVSSPHTINAAADGEPAVPAPETAEGDPGCGEPDPAPAGEAPETAGRLLVAAPPLPGSALPAAWNPRLRFLVPRCRRR